MIGTAILHTLSQLTSATAGAAFDRMRARRANGAMRSGATQAGFSAVVTTKL